MDNWLLVGAGFLVLWLGMKIGLWLDPSKVEVEYLKGRLNNAIEERAVAEDALYLAVSDLLPPTAYYEQTEPLYTKYMDRAEERAGRGKLNA